MYLTVHVHLSSVLANKSVNGNLAYFVNSTTDALANKNQVDVIYSDFAKSCDKAAMINNFEFDYYTFNSGVSQGSNLS